MSDNKAVSVLFVCLGNICRSPTAQGIFHHLVEKEGLSDAIHIDSAGTGDWHVGKAPDPRTLAAAQARGYDFGHLRARLVSPEDFTHYDYILAMDAANLDNLKAMKPDGYSGYLGLFLEFSDYPEHREVPDPYYGGEEGFELVLDLIQSASEGLLEHIKRHHFA